MDDQSHIVAAEAAVTAVLEPPRRRLFSRRRKVQPPPLPYCENCGAPMAGPFCAQCGQAAIDYRRSFRHIIVDVLDSFLNWDSKFFATIAWLIARPWHLTNQFLAGRRVRYVHPLRLYLLVSILFFFVVNYWAKSIHADPSKLSAEDRADIAADLNDPDIPPAVKARVRGALEAKGMTQPEAQTSPSPEAAVSPRPTAIFSIDHLVYALHIHSFAYLAIMLIVLITIGLNRSIPGTFAGWIIAALWITFAVQVFLSIRRLYRQGWFFTVFKFFLGGFAYLVVLTVALATTFFITIALP